MNQKRILANGSIIRKRANQKLKRKAEQDEKDELARSLQDTRRSMRRSNCAVKELFER